MAPLYVVLLHHPVYDKHGQIVATAVTNMDVHDLARIAKTYGIAGVFIATPVRALRLLAEKILEHWRTGFGAEYNETRREALALVHTRGGPRRRRARGRARSRRAADPRGDERQGRPESQDVL